jgi:hypothetical protein
MFARHIFDMLRMTFPRSGLTASGFCFFQRTCSRTGFLSASVHTVVQGNRGHRGRGSGNHPSKDKIPGDKRTGLQDSCGQEQTHPFVSFTRRKKQ